MGVGSQKEKGTTFVEILVAMTIFGVITLGIAEFFRSTENTRRRLSLKRVMETLSQDLYHKVSNPYSVYLSLGDTAANTDLINCLESPASCRASSPESALGFRLAYESSSRDLAYAAGPRVSSGWGGDSVCYDTNGTPCDCDNATSEDGASCVFIGETSFYMRCGGENMSCEEGAASLHLSYRVRQKTGTLKNLGRELLDLPSQDFFVHHPLNSIFDPRFNSECNTGAVVIGFSKEGRALCECVGEYKSIGVENKRGPLCEKSTGLVYECPEDTVPIGLTHNHTVECVPFEEAYECQEVSGDEVENTTCLEGYWLQKYYRKTCVFYCSVDSAEGGECLNEFENSQDASGRKVGLWCYGESPYDSGTEDVKICCRRKFTGF